MSKYLSKTIFFFLISLTLNSASYADIVFGFNGSYSQIKDKRTDAFGFAPLGAGYGIELGAKAGPFLLMGNYSKATLSDDIIHDSITGEFSLAASSFSAFLDTYITRGAFFGVGYGSWSRAVSLTGSYDTSTQANAFSKYYLEDKVSDNGMLLRVGYSFWKTKSFAASCVYQKNLYSDNQSENQFLFNLRFFLRSPKFGSGR